MRTRHSSTTTGVPLGFLMIVTLVIGVGLIWHTDAIVGLIWHADVIDAATRTHRLIEHLGIALAVAAVLGFTIPCWSLTNCRP